MKELKNALFDIALNYVKERINTAESALKNNRSDLEKDTKSSAGDKYETSREIVQQEVIRNELLLSDAYEMKTTLSKIDLDHRFETIQNGSLAITNKGTFFFAVAGGKFEYKSKDYFIISINSPLGKILKDKKAGDKAVFNGQNYTIKEVY